MAEGITVEFDPSGKFKRALGNVSENAKDLTIPLTLVAKQWFSSNRAFFKLTGPGGFADLAESTKKQKARNPGFVYPILLGKTGTLRSSISIRLTATPLIRSLIRLS